MLLTVFSIIFVIIYRTSRLTRKRNNLFIIIFKVHFQIMLISFLIYIAIKYTDEQPC